MTEVRAGFAGPHRAGEGPRRTSPDGQLCIPLPLHWVRWAKPGADFGFRRLARATNHELCRRVRQA
jgi:hypothetical protein